MKNPRNVLAEAAEIISERGHAKGEFTDPVTGGVCAMGALFRASEGSTQACAAAVAILHNHILFRHIPTWNDHPDVTAEDVILMLKKLGAGE